VSESIALSNGRQVAVISACESSGNQRRYNPFQHVVGYSRVSLSNGTSGLWKALKQVGLHLALLFCAISSEVTRTCSSANELALPLKTTAVVPRGEIWVEFFSGFIGEVRI
jgi:hypothetical protein